MMGEISPKIASKLAKEAYFAQDGLQAKRRTSAPKHSPLRHFSHWNVYQRWQTVVRPGFITTFVVFQGFSVATELPTGAGPITIESTGHRLTDFAGQRCAARRL